MPPRPANPPPPTASTGRPQTHTQPDKPPSIQELQTYAKIRDSPQSYSVRVWCASVNKLIDE
ncbi:hypothetical protein HK102_009796, partial [Quaeritorhiza haematococci]